VLQLLLHNPLEVPTGLALQTYSVPGLPLQKRLYMTWSTLTSDWETPMPDLQGSIRVVRVKLNKLESEPEPLKVTVVEKKGPVPSMGSIWKEAKTSMCALVDLEETKKTTNWHKWKNLTTDVIPDVGPSNHIMRMAFADAKLFYMAAKAESTYQLKSTGVTMAVPCSVMALVSDAFKSWAISPSDHGKVLKAPHKDFDLHETSVYAGAMPWRFDAYKKVVRWKNLLVSAPRPRRVLAPCS
jgi:hypothetical protein